ncbi:sulfatase, partial [Streptomyces solisilvae]
MSRQSSSHQRSETDKGTTEEGPTEGPAPEGPPQRTPDIPAQRREDAGERDADPEQEVGTVPGVAAAREGWRAKYPVVARTVAWTVTGLSFALVFLALSLPTKLTLLEPSAFLRIPVEGIFGATLLLMLPSMARRVVA